MKLFQIYEEDSQVITIDSDTESDEDDLDFYVVVRGPGNTHIIETRTHRRTVVDNLVVYG